MFADKYKCREVWSDKALEIAFNVFLDIILFVIPLIIMAFNYIVISMALNEQNNQYIINYQNYYPNSLQINDTSEPNTDQNSSFIDGSVDSIADNGLNGVVTNALMTNVSNDSRGHNHVIIKRNTHLFREKSVNQRQHFCGFTLFSKSINYFIGLTLLLLSVTRRDICRESSPEGTQSKCSSYWWPTSSSAGVSHLKDISNTFT